MWWRRLRRPTGRARKAGRGAHARVLAHIPALSGLSPHEIDALGAACVEREYPAGTSIVRQGEPGPGLCVVLRGRVWVTRHHQDHRGQRTSGEQLLAVLGPAECIEETTMLGGVPCAVSVTTVLPTNLLIAPLRESPAWRAKVSILQDVGQDVG
jgi:CRP-like cAMP-binding protein